VCIFGGFVVGGVCSWPCGLYGWVVLLLTGGGFCFCGFVFGVLCFWFLWVRLWFDVGFGYGFRVCFVCVLWGILGVVGGFFWVGLFVCWAKAWGWLVWLFLGYCLCECR